ncbi:hypothetical protein PIB30_058644 [Stylosanthes scabra]|uniref:Uncharacterized protein n=1 Tax=Stylosanthes scabra TaxID=79078 RepID=A0ABU6UJ37_9FABA|nr:hypothetical protein [Stylosanthes scabra]
MFDSAKALAFENVPTRDEIKEAIFQTLVMNGMFDNSHIRLSLTWGKKRKKYYFVLKVTSGMSPAFNLYGCTLIVLAEWKPPVYDNTHGIILVTASTCRNLPNNLDSKIHHNNLLNNILAKIEGNNAKADDAIMLDKDDYLSETNATNIFIVKKGCVLTPHADYCLPGITRATVMDLVVKEQLILEERRISLSEVHTADETMGMNCGEFFLFERTAIFSVVGIGSVVKVDGRTIGNGEVGPVTKRLQAAYKKLTQDFAAAESDLYTPPRLCHSSSSTRCVSAVLRAIAKDPSRSCAIDAPSPVILHITSHHLATVNKYSSPPTLPAADSKLGPSAPSSPRQILHPDLIPLFATLLLPTSPEGSVLSPLLASSPPSATFVRQHQSRGSIANNPPPFLSVFPSYGRLSHPFETAAYHQRYSTWFLA